MRDRTVKVTISGRVQHVGFRAWAVKNARELGISGWVRNRADGTVEAIFSGIVVQVNEMLKRCQVGPSTALVEDVNVEDSTETVERGFKELPTVR